MKPKTKDNLIIAVGSVISLTIIIAIFALPEFVELKPTRNYQQKSYNSNPNSNIKSQNSALVNQLNQKYIGSTYDIDLGELFIEKYGYPERLNGTNNYVWVAYFPKGNFTMTQTKIDHQIVKFETGKRPRSGG